MRSAPWTSIAAAALAAITTGTGTATGCSYTFDSSAVEVPLVGDPIPPSTYPKLNIDGAPISELYVMKGIDGVQWAIMFEAQAAALLPPPLNTPMRTVARLSAIDDTGRTELVTADEVLVSSKLIYLLDVPADETAPVRLRLRAPGDSGGRELTMPPGSPELIASGNDAAFAYLPIKMDTTSYTVLRSDGSFQRQIPLPPGIDINHLFDTFRLFFDSMGDTLISRDSDGHVIAHSTRAETDTDLGITDPGLFFDSTRTGLISCGPGGLKRMPLSGSPATTLDPAACTPDIYGETGTTLIYHRDDGIYQIPELGGTPVSLLQPPFGQVYAISSNLTMPAPVIYSLDPPMTYGSGIGDGWLGDWRFMNRGRRPTWSGDYSRVRWLENSARSDGSGDFMSATIPGGDPLLLARNVRQFSEPYLGKVLAISNAAGKGAYNRLIVISEADRVAHWLVDSARQYTRVPGTNEVLVQIVNGQIGYDIVRVPIP